jgi:hypothetical protein
MTKRDEFLEPTKKALAERCGFRCSYLGCPNATSGPSEESETAVARTGVACHITAASPGGKRYDSNLSPEVRRSISNGIWMCTTHSVAIDRDEARYTVSVLNHWKEIAEAKADIAKNHGWDFFDKNNYFPVDSLADINLSLDSSSNSNTLIGNAISDSCLPHIWGKSQSLIIRDLLIELYRNAFTHGNASNYEVKITSKKIEIRYDGEAFNIFSLLSHAEANGGADTLREIIENHQDSFVVNYSFDSNNRIILHTVKAFSELSNSLPCIITIDAFDSNNVVDQLDIHVNCGAIYIILPMHFCRSDVRGLESNLSGLKPTGTPIFIVGSEITENTKRAIIDRLPDFSFVHNIADN